MGSASKQVLDQDTGPTPYLPLVCDGPCTCVQRSNSRPAAILLLVVMVPKLLLLPCLQNAIPAVPVLLLGFIAQEGKELVSSLCTGCYDAVL